MNKLTKILTAGALAVGLTLVATTPAEAVNLYRYCNWPYKSSITVTYPRLNRGTVYAYSPGGALLGVKSGVGSVQWNSPWEDVRWVVNSYSFVETWCRK